MSKRKRRVSPPVSSRICPTCGGPTRTFLGRAWCDNCSENPYGPASNPLWERPSIYQHLAEEGRHIDEWGLSDLESWNQETQPEPPFRRFTNSISLREYVLDEWARTERLLRAVSAFLTPGQSREDAWKTSRARRTRQLIDDVAQQTRDDGKAPPGDFQSALWDLYQLRNLLAHNDSRPLPLAPKSGVRVLRTLQFNKGTYTDVLNGEMRRKTNRAHVLTTWLAGHYPEGDGVLIDLDDDEVARLIAEFPEEL